MEISGIAAVGVAGCLTALLVAQDRKEYALFLTLCVGLFISLSVLTRLHVVMEALNQIADSLPTCGSLLRMLFKMIGIAYITEFASAICRDAGYASVGVQLETFGKLVILSMSAPLLLSLLERLGGLLG